MRHALMHRTLMSWGGLMAGCSQSFEAPPLAQSRGAALWQLPLSLNLKTAARRQNFALGWRFDDGFCRLAA